MQLNAGNTNPEENAFSLQGILAHAVFLSRNIAETAFSVDNLFCNALSAQTNVNPALKKQTKIPNTNKKLKKEQKNLHVAFHLQQIMV